MQGQAVSAGASILTNICIQPDRRAPEWANWLAALKPSLDDVADVLLINDARFDPVALWGVYGAEPGAVRIEIESTRVTN